MRTATKVFTVVAALAVPLVQALELNVFSDASVKNVTSIIVYNLMTYYTGNVTNTPSTIGVLPQPYYWWEAGAMWGALIDYYHYTGDDSYNEVTTQALLSQVGPGYDFMMADQEFDEGNDDQSFWGFAAMSAAEKGYPEPPAGQPSWLQITENLWNTQVNRWDTTTCNGGLRWQIYPANKGYTYKNSVANGAFFQISARLARFTGNQTYLDWALKSYDWSVGVGLIDSEYHVYDGAGDTTNCSNPSQVIWTYNTGVYLYGAAVLYNHTNGSDIWAERTQGFLNAAAQYFNPYGNASNVMVETACEPVDTCDNDQFSFKGYLSRWMWASTLMAPFTLDKVTTYLRFSSLAAARSCSGGTNGVTCGEHWYWETAYDGVFGVGQQMSALETIQGLLATQSVPPLKSSDFTSGLRAEAC